MKALMAWLYERAIKNALTSLVGVGFAVAMETLNFLGTITLPGWAHWLVGAVTAMLTLSKDSIFKWAASKSVAPLLILGFLTLPGCALFQNIGKGSLSCVGAAGIEVIKAVVALPEWKALLDDMKATIGPELLRCELQEVLTELGKASVMSNVYVLNNGGEPPVTTEQKVARVEGYLASLK